MNKNKLSHVVETLMYQVDEDTLPCEAGLDCPFRDDHNPHEYCVNGDCVKGITKLIMELCEK